MPATAERANLIATLHGIPSVTPPYSIYGVPFYDVGDAPVGW
jgi:hypothetical protein